MVATLQNFLTGQTDAAEALTALQHQKEGGEDDFGVVQVRKQGPPKRITCLAHLIEKKALASSPKLHLERNGSRENLDRR